MRTISERVAYSRFPDIEQLLISLNALMWKKVRESGSIASSNLELLSGKLKQTYRHPLLLRTSVAFLENPRSEIADRWLAYVTDLHACSMPAGYSVRLNVDERLYLPCFGIDLPRSPDVVLTNCGSGWTVEGPHFELRNIVWRDPYVRQLCSGGLLKAETHSVFDSQTRTRLAVDCRVLEAVLPSAMALIQSLIPSLASVIDQRIMWFVALPSEPGTLHASFTAQDFPGVIFLSPLTDITRIAETIVHEHAHNELNELTLTESLADEHSSDLFYSPWRSDARPLAGLLHAIYSFGQVAEFYLRLQEHNVANAYWIDRRLALTKCRLNAALMQLGKTRLSPLAQEIAASVSDVAEEIALDPHMLGCAGEAVNQHFQSWRSRFPDIGVQAWGERRTCVIN